MPDTGRPGDQTALVTDLASFERLIRVETKLDLVIESKTATHADLEIRIRKLERVYWKATGMAAVVSAVIATGAGFVIRLIGAS